MKLKKHFLVYFLIFLFVILTSEIFYSFKNRTLFLERIFFQLVYSNTRFEDTLIKVVPDLYTKSYLSYLKDITLEETAYGCKPLCVSYVESLNLLKTFQKIENTKIFELTDLQSKSEYYYLMATAAVRVDFHTASIYLDKSLEYFPQNSKSLKFKNQINTIFQIFHDLNARNDVDVWLQANPETLMQFERDYLAFAANELGGLYDVGSLKSLNYFEIAVNLNPWNEEYYMDLYNAYKVKKDQGVLTVLEKCIEKLGSDAGRCLSEKNTLKR